MAELSYLLLKNETTGEEIPGDCLDKNYEGHIEVVAFDQETIRPTHPQTGQVTGETNYGALKIIKPIDKSSPLLQKGISEGNSYGGSIKFLRTGKDGRREHWYTIEFAQAPLVSIKMYKPTILAQDSSLPDLEEVSFRFVKITWRHETESKEATTDWSNR